MKVQLSLKLKPIALIVVFLSAAVLFSYRLDQVPQGITADEGAIGYNAVLLSRTLKDETGRFMPFFTLTINSTDWKQPLTQYATAFVFKLLPPSVSTLRLVSVAAALVGLALLMWLSSGLLGARAAMISAFVYLLTPAVIIHSHLGQENVMPIPFTLVWLIGLYLYQTKRSAVYLLLSGISLGLGFYSYRGMRLIVPIWLLISLVYLFGQNLEHFKKKNYRQLPLPFIAFCFGIFPFLAVAPLLNKFYANAVFDANSAAKSSIYDYLFTYLTSFDPSHLFVRGDITPWHSTGIHGFFLISTAPIFLIGLHRAIKNGDYWWLVIASFITAPFLYGLANSSFRYSRLLALVPSYILLATLGLETLWEIKLKKALVLIIPAVFLVIIINGVDFLNYYWNTYPKITQADFLINNESAFNDLKRFSDQHGYSPYIENDLYNTSENYKFFISSRFPQVPQVWKPGDKLPQHAVLLTKLREQPDLISRETSYPELYLMVNTTDQNILDRYEIK